MSATAPAVEQRQLLLESCAAASPAAPAAEQRQQETTTAASAAKPEEIMQTLPPSDADVSKYISVCFNQEKVSRAQLVSQKALTVDPAEYIRCARLRQQVCPVFADVAIDEERARQQWPQPGVPPGIAEGA